MTATLLLALAPLLVPQAESPTADELVFDGASLLPVYTGDHREALPALDRRRVEAGAHLFAAATALEPEHVRALWYYAHAEVLLATDAQFRGRDAEVRERFAVAEHSLTRAMEIDARDPWAPYARGVARSAIGDHAGAYADLVRATDVAVERMGGTEGDDAWLRFKALEWRCEVLMRAGEYGRAREEMRAFHGEFSENAFPLEIALAESFQREGALDSARACYERIVAAFPDDPQAYALLGYVAGLTGDQARAAERLNESIDRERSPDLYTRLWLWILAEGGPRAAAETELREFVAAAPPSATAWDLRLGRFVLGEGAPEEFIAAALAEVDRRVESYERIDDLLCEAWFYAGLRRELDGEDQEARTAFRAALEFEPATWKWERAFARQRLSDSLERARRTRATRRIVARLTYPDGEPFLDEVSLGIFRREPGSSQWRGYRRTPDVDGVVEVSFFDRAKRGEVLPTFEIEVSDAASYGGSTTFEDGLCTVAEAPGALRPLTEEELARGASEDAVIDLGVLVLEPAPIVCDLRFAEPTAQDLDVDFQGLDSEDELENRLWGGALHPDAQLPAGATGLRIRRRDASPFWGIQLREGALGIAAWEVVPRGVPYDMSVDRLRRVTVEIEREAYPELRRVVLVRPGWRDALPEDGVLRGLRGRESLEEHARLSYPASSLEGGTAVFVTSDAEYTVLVVTAEPDPEDLWTFRVAAHRVVEAAREDVTVRFP